MANILRKQNQMISAGGGGGSSEEYTDIDYEDWVELTPAEQESGKYYIHGAPGADGDISVDLMTKLWENPNPTASFESQDVTLSSSDYDVLMIISRTANKDHVAIIRKGEDGITQYSAGTIRYRLISYVSDTKLNFANGSYNSTYNSNPTTNNDYCIPIVIYGIKTTVTAKINAIATDVSTSADKCMLDDGVTSVEDALDGFRFYAAGTSIVGLVSDYSPYTDSDGNYILANSTTGQSMIDNVTYKSIASTEDTRGKAGADSATPFKKGGGGGGATLIGTYSGNQNIDVSEYLQSGDTVDNFIVEFVSVPSSSTSQTSGTSKATYGGWFGGNTMSKSLSGTALTISGMSIQYGLNTSGWGVLYRTTVSLNYKVYHV